MAKIILNEETRKTLSAFLEKNRPAELIPTYLFFVQTRFNCHPVCFPRDKIIFESLESAIEHLEREGKLWHHTEIKISFGEESVNEETTKVYICPFTGKVFGNNTHPNPQDAIYDWVSKCPENTERSGGLRIKRFFVSEDPEVIKNYCEKNQTKKPVTKMVFSSGISGKLFNSREAVIEDFKNNYIKEMTLVEVQNQNKFSIEEKFLEFLQKQLEEDKIAAFVEAMADIPEYQPIVEHWLG